LNYIINDSEYPEEMPFDMENMSIQEMRAKGMEVISEIELDNLD
jgi:hypothetical protein